MRADSLRWLAVLCLAATCSTGSILLAKEQQECAECDRVLARVQQLLPHRPNSVVVLDANRQPPSLRRHMEEAEGFITTGDDTVYLKKQGSTFQLALRGPGIADYALAIIIWHEMAHLAGADEREAQRQEENLWVQFIVQQRVDSRRGFQYLALLRKRHS
jgi:hypothetical protein